MMDILKMITSLIPIVIIFLKMVLSLDTISVEYFLMETKKEEKSRLYNYGLLLVLLILCSALYNYIFSEILSKYMNRWVCIGYVVLLVILVISTAVFRIREQYKIARLICLVTNLLIWIYFCYDIIYIEKIIVGKEYYIIFIISIIEAAGILISSELLRRKKADQEAQFSVILEDNKYYILSRVGDRLICGAGRTLRKSATIKVIKIDDIVKNNLIINNLHAENNTQDSTENSENCKTQ